MAQAETHKLLELIVQAIDKTISVNSVTLVSGSVYTLTTNNTKWLNVGRTYTIDSDDYVVTDITPNTSFQITLNDGQTPPTAVDFDCDDVTFLHGTFNFASQERTQDMANLLNKVPFIYFNEPSTDRRFPSMEDARDRESDCDLYFMHEANATDWTNEKHYYYCIAGMENLKRAFLQAAENKGFVGEIENYSDESHVKWGVVNINGHVRNIFPENLSGKKVIITIPFLKMACDTDYYTPPYDGNITLNFYLDGVLVNSETVSASSDNTFNITWQ